MAFSTILRHQSIFHISSSHFYDAYRWMERTRNQHHHDATLFSCVCLTALRAWGWFPWTLSENENLNQTSTCKCLSPSVNSWLSPTLQIFRMRIIFTIRRGIYRDMHFLVYHIMYPLMQLAHLTEHNEKCMITRKLFSTNDTILYSLPLTIEAFWHPPAFG